MYLAAIVIPGFDGVDDEVWDIRRCHSPEEAFRWFETEKSQMPPGAVSKECYLDVVRDESIPPARASV